MTPQVAALGKGVAGLPRGRSFGRGSAQFNCRAILPVFELLPQHQFGLSSLFDGAGGWRKRDKGPDLVKEQARARSFFPPPYGITHHTAWRPVNG